MLMCMPQSPEALRAEIGTVQVAVHATGMAVRTTHVPVGVVIRKRATGMILWILERVVQLRGFIST